MNYRKFIRINILGIIFFSLLIIFFITVLFVRADYIRVNYSVPIPTEENTCDLDPCAPQCTGCVSDPPVFEGGGGGGEF